MIETYIVNDIIVTKRGSEIVKLLLAKDGVEIVWPYPVPEDPPADRDQPHDHDHHHKDVIEEITAELTAQPPVVLAGVLDLLHGGVDGYPDQEQDGDPQPPYHQEPGQVGLSWTPWVLLSWRSSFPSSNQDHEEEDREAKNIENTNTPHSPLIMICEEPTHFLNTVSMFALHHITL